MGLLSRNAAPLLRTVAGKEHATTDDHQNSGAESTDDDKDKTPLGPPPKRKGIVRPPQKTFKKVVDTHSPAKREAEPEDVVENLIFGDSSSSQSKRPRKTFTRKYGSQNNKPMSQQKPSTQFVKPEIPQASDKVPEVKKKGFRFLPSAGLSSSQPEPLPAPSAPTFRKPAAWSDSLAADSTEASAHSQSLALESSQLSAPLSSSPSSLPESEPDLDLDLIGKIICPICGDKVETEFRDNFQNEVCSGRRMNLRLQEKFCRAHKARNATDVWRDRGYPDIDWSSLQRRLQEHHDHIRAVLDGTYDSPFRMQHAKLLTSHKAKSATSAAASGNFTGLRTGYYGTRGEKMIAENIVRAFSSRLRSLSTNDKLIASSGASGGISGYIHAVLVPEMALSLIMEDMECDRERAQIILTDSADLGEVFNEEEDEKVPRVEMDLLDTSQFVDDSGGTRQRRSITPILLD